MISPPEEGGLPGIAESQMRFSDDELVDGLRTRSTQAWAEIMTVYRPRVYAAALRLTRNHHDAEDIAQETFLRAVRGASRFRAESSLGTWLVAIANNLSRNHDWYWRRRKRDKSLSIDGPVHDAEAATVGDTLASEDPIASAQTERNDLLNQLERGMARLSERDRRILALRDRHHASYDEIARALVIPLGTVKSRIGRARERLLATVREMIAADVAMEARPGSSLAAAL
jgi:RNA polymerase sigma-70 factor (ECF subfamily)